MQFYLAPGTFEYIHADGCGGSSGCSKIIYSIKSNSEADDDASAPAINVYGFNRANLMAYATSGASTGSIAGYTQTNTQCTDVTDVTGTSDDASSDDALGLAGATFTGGDALYLVVECPSSSSGCEVEAAIKWTSSSTAGQCSTPKELDNSADNVRKTVVSAGGKWVGPAIKPCGSNGCTNLEYSLTSWGIGAFDFVALDETNKALFESGQAYTALNTNGLRSQTDVICASGKGVTTPAGTKKVYLGVSCRSTEATSPCALSFFLQFDGDASANDDSTDDYPVGDDDTLGNQCDSAIASSGVTLTPFTIAAGKFHILPMDGCGTTGCTDIKIAAKSTDTSEISLYAMDLYDLIGLMAGGDFSFDQAEAEAECAYIDGFSSSTVGGSHYFVVVQCVTGKSAAGACKVEAGFSRVQGSGANDDDGPGSCVDPASNFAAADVKSQTITSGDYHTITIDGCGSDLGKCTNVKWAAKSSSDTFAVMGISDLAYTDVTDGRWNQVRAEEVFVPWTSCHGDLSGDISVGQDLDRFYFIIVCLDNDGASCDVSYALTYDPYVQPSPSSQPVNDDAMFDDDGDWSNCIEPSAIGTKSSTTLIEDAWDADTIQVQGCSASTGCQDIKYSVRTTDGSEIHVYGLTGAEAAKIRSTGSSDGVTSLFEAHKQDCVSDDSGNRNGPAGQTAFVLAVYCYKPAADGFCAMDYIVEATLPSPTPTPSTSSDPSPSSSPSASPTPTRAPPSQSPSASPSITSSPGRSASPSASRSVTPSPSSTRSVSPSPSITPTASIGQTPTASITPSPTNTASNTPSWSPTASVSPSPSISFSSTPSLSATPTKSVGASVSSTPTGTVSANASTSANATTTAAVTPSTTISVTPTSTPAPSASPTPRYCPAADAVFPSAGAAEYKLSQGKIARLSFGRDTRCTSSSQCTGVRFVVENMPQTDLPKSFFDVYGMSLADFNALDSGSKQLANVTIYQPYDFQSVTCVWQDVGLVTPVLSAGGGVSSSRSSSSSSSTRRLSGAAQSGAAPDSVLPRQLAGSEGAVDTDDNEEFVLVVYCRTPDAISSQCNIRAIVQAVPGYDPDAPPSPTPTPAPAGEQPCPLSPAAVTSLSDSSHTDTVGSTTTSTHESSAPALLTLQAGTFIVLDLIGCESAAGCTDLAVAARLANAKPTAGGTTIETGRRFTVAGMTGAELTEFLLIASSPGWDRTIPLWQTVQWRSNDLTRCFPPAPASRRAAAKLLRALHGVSRPEPAADREGASPPRGTLRLSKGQRLWMPAGDGLAIDNDGTGTGTGWLSSSDTAESPGREAEGLADISTPAARRALAAAAGMPEGTTSTPPWETFHIVIACEPEAPDAAAPDFCSIEYALAYERQRQSVAPGGRVDTGSVADDDLILEEPDAGSGSGAGYGSTLPGQACGADGECSTFACRGGFCCDASALEADSEESGTPACAVCVAGDGTCGLRSGDPIGSCPLSCDDDGTKLACGARADGSFFCGQMYNASGKVLGIAGHCMCGGDAVSWTTIGVDPTFGVPTAIECASTSLKVCPAVVAAAVRRTSDAKAAAQANPAGGGGNPAPGDNGLGLAVGLGFVGVVALVAAGWFGVSYVRTHRPDWAVERGFVPAFSDADIEQRARRVSRLGRRTRWEVHKATVSSDNPVVTPEPESDVLEEPTEVGSASPTVNPLATASPDLSRRSQRVLLGGAGREV